MLDHKHRIEPPFVPDDWRLILMSGVLLALALLASGIHDQDDQDCTPRGVTTNDTEKTHY